MTIMNPKFYIKFDVEEDFDGSLICRYDFQNLTKEAIEKLANNGDGDFTKTLLSKAEQIQKEQGFYEINFDVIHITNTNSKGKVDLDITIDTNKGLDNDARVNRKAIFLNRNSFDPTLLQLVLENINGAKMCGFGTMKFIDNLEDRYFQTTLLCPDSIESLEEYLPEAKIVRQVSGLNPRIVYRVIEAKQFLEKYNSNRITITPDEVKTEVETEVEKSKAIIADFPINIPNIKNAIDKYRIAQERRSKFKRKIEEIIKPSRKLGL